MNNPDVNKKYYRIGIAFIVLGVILILNRLNIIPWQINLSHLIFSWQMLLILIGAIAYKLKNKNTAIILMGMGVFFLIPEIFNLPEPFKAVYWPSFLIFIGVFLLLQHRKRLQATGTHANSNETDQSNDDVFNRIDDFVIFASKEVKVETKNMEGGQVAVLFGSSDYDMRTASIQQNQIVLDCSCIFGGISLKVPAGWKIKNEIKTVLGGVSDDRLELPDNGSQLAAKIILLKGICICGGVEIRY